MSFRDWWEVVPATCDKCGYTTKFTRRRWRRLFECRPVNHSDCGGKIRMPGEINGMAAYLEGNPPQ